MQNQHEQIKTFLDKQLELVTVDSQILNAMLADPELESRPLSVSELGSKCDKIADFSQKIGYLSGKIDAIKELMKFLNIQ